MDEQQTRDADIPRAIALAWGVAANPSRGPKRELSIERIVDTAIEIADEGGLGAVSMSSVASRLGFTPMSLYRYVSAKEDLVLLMQERGIGVPPEDLERGDGWRPAIERWSQAMAALYVEHPWLLDIPITGSGVTPNNLAWLDAALAVLAPLPFDPNRKLSVVLALLAQGRFAGTVMRGYRQTASASGGIDDIASRDEALMAQLVTPEEFPEVHAAFAAGAFSDDAGGDPFGFGADRVLDGVEALLGGTIVAPPPHAVPDVLDEAAARDPKVKEAVKARRDAEKALREARKREREQLANARERAKKASAK